uniref:C1q domain-containing protein n=2 Tax=Gasterosteus aculeatus aculeatus TaxID=481459 RepID=A0AAQ4QPY6_GASAC
RLHYYYHHYYTTAYTTTITTTTQPLTLLLSPLLHNRLHYYYHHYYTTAYTTTTTTTTQPLTLLLPPLLHNQLTLLPPLLHNRLHYYHHYYTTAYTTTTTTTTQLLTLLLPPLLHNRLHYYHHYYTTANTNTTTTTTQPANTTTITTTTTTATTQPLTLLLPRVHPPHSSSKGGHLSLSLRVDEPPTEFDAEAELKALQASLKQVQTDNLEVKERLESAERELKATRDVPKVAFAVSLGGNGLQEATTGRKTLIYKDVMTNIGQAYSSETGEFTAPIRGVYYVRFTANAPTNFPMSAVLYKNGAEVQLIAHEQPSGEGSDTASNGAALLLQAGDKLKMMLWHNTHIWDNSNHHSTFSGFLLFPL